jgi:D-ribulokinase
MSRYYLGVDVGTGSARAGVFDHSGTLLGSGKHDISLHREPGEIVEQSSDEIWRAVAASVRHAVAEAAVGVENIAGIGFDATCSLVVLGPGGRPLPVGPSGDPNRNVIVWMDHRALAQAERINASRHRVLDYVGGTISPEMETPKLLWLAEHQAATFAAAWQFMDLADYLTWRATDSLVRSTCTVTCKWTYLAHEARWDASFFHAVGLGQLADGGFARIGTDIRAPGSPIGGLTPEAAADLGLPPGIAVATSLIDAHAGAIGTVGARGGPGSIASRMGYVVGTSACTLASTTGPTFVPGVWGPYYSALLPETWLLEGGQSAAGAAIDQLVAMHPAASSAAAEADRAGLGLGAWLADRVARRTSNLSDAVRFADDLHVVPEFLGNRSPFADPHAKAIIAGLTLDASIDSLEALYIAGLTGLGYGCRQIVEAMRDKGVDIDTIMVSGGAAASPLVRQVLADSTGLAVASPVSSEPVLLGSAILGAVAAGDFPGLQAAMRAMSNVGEIHAPARDEIALRHAARFAAFVELQSVERRLRSRNEALV